MIFAQKGEIVDRVDDLGSEFRVFLGFKAAVLVGDEVEEVGLGGGERLG